MVLTCTTGVPQEYHRITTGNLKTYMYHRITTEPVWYMFHSCGNFCGTHLYNRGTTEVPQDIFVPQDYHTVIGPLPQNLCGICFIPVVISVVLTCTTGVPHKYHRSTTGHFCTTGLPHKLPQNLCGIFLIPVVMSVVLTCTTGVPHKYHRVPHKYHRVPQAFFCKGRKLLSTRSATRATINPFRPTRKQQACR